MPTIGGTALSNARRVGQRDAVITADRRWTWKALDVDIAEVAGRLIRLGLRKGDRLALLSKNSPDFIIASHAASRLGAIVVPVNTRSAPPELAYLLDDSGASVLAFAPSEIGLAESSTRSSRGVTLAGLGPAGDHVDLMSGSEPDPVHEDRASEADDAFILYTSGTTGKPKGCLVDHHRAVWAAMAQIVSLGLRDGDRYLHLAPMYHSGGVTFTNVTTLLGGAHIVAPHFDAATVLRLVERHSATWLFGVPTMYQQMLRCEDVRARDTSSWRVGVFGAAPMPAPTIEGLMRSFPGVEFFQQCGQTEAGPTGIYSTMDQIRSQPDSSGHLAQPFTEARVVDEKGADTPTGRVGELVFRGEGVVKEYWRRPEATATIIRDGWLHTGDLMHVGDNGALRLVDRLKDVIISGGRNVYSAEVEQAIARHRDVADVAVVGRPDPEWGETIIAMVTTVVGVELTESDVQQHCRPLIADYKIPRIVMFGEVPRNGSGKLQKHLLRETLR